MTILFEIGHPAHLHYFRNAAKILQLNGDFVYFCLRDKDITKSLIDEYNFKYFKIGKNKKGLGRKILGVFCFTFKIIKIINKIKPDIVISFYSPYAAYASFLKGIPSIGYADTEHAKINIKTTYPFTTVSLTPKYFNVVLGEKHLFFDGFMELNYLHPNYFKPDKSIISQLDLRGKKYIILRFVSWDAHHDIGQYGLTLETKRAIIKRLKPEFRIFISSEGSLGEEFESYRLNIPFHQMHDILAYAHMYIGEGATMASECAMLGTPAIYVNSLDAGTLQEQERRGLIASFRSSEGVLDKIEEWVEDKNLHVGVKTRRDIMLKEMIDPTKMLLWFVENFPESFKILKDNPGYQHNFK